MTRTLTLLATAGVLAALSGPALAEIDAGALTCQQFTDMDAATRSEATNAVMSFVMDAANTKTSAAAAVIISDMEADEVHSRIDAVCQNQAVGITVISVLQ